MNAPASAKKALSAALCLALAGGLCPSASLAYAEQEGVAPASAAQADSEGLTAPERIEQFIAALLDSSATANASEAVSAGGDSNSDALTDTASSSKNLPVNFRKAAVLEEGTYRLYSVANPKRAVAVSDASMAQGTNLQMVARAKGLDAQWQIESAGSGYYLIRNAKSGKVLTCEASVGKPVAGNSAVQERWKKQAAQKWKLVDEGSGRFAIVSALDRTVCLEAASAKAKTGSNVRLGAYAKKRSQQFQLKEARAQLSRSQLLNALSAAKAGQGVTAFNGGAFDAHSKAGMRLLKAIQALRKRDMRCSVVLLDLNSGAGISYAPDEVYFGASTAKGPYVASICKNRQAEARAAADLITLAIKVSSNSDYAALRMRFGSDPEARAMAYAQVPEDAYGDGELYPYLSARNLARLWVGNYWYFFKDTNGSSAWCRNLFKDTKCSFANQALGGAYQVYSKAGWDDSSGNVHHDAAVVMDPDHPYVLVCMTTAYTHDDLLHELVCAADAVHTEMVD